MDMTVVAVTAQRYLWFSLGVAESLCRFVRGFLKHQGITCFSL